MGRLVKNRALNNGALTVKIPSVTTAQRPSGANGDLIYNTTIPSFQVYQNGWANVSSGNSGLGTITLDVFQGDGSTQTFGNGIGNTLDGSSAANLSFSVTDATDIMVFVGGVYQIPDINYTVSGTTITFGSVVPGNDGSGSSDHIITIIHGLNKLGE
jgi:hypothetical protein